jgi:hypothetical protein
VTTWHGSRSSEKRDRVIARLAGGYDGGDPGVLAVQAGEILAAWNRMLAEHPMTDLHTQVTTVAADAGEASWDEDGEEPEDLG